MPGGETPGHVRSVATDHDRDTWPLDRLGNVDRVSNLRIASLECRVLRLVARQHPRDDFEIVAETCQSLLRLGIAVTVGKPLVALPAGTDPELHPAAADGVHRRDHPCRQRRV